MPLFDLQRDRSRFYYHVNIIDVLNHRIVRVKYLRSIFISSALVVRSIDLIWTLVFGVMGELACLNGLKFIIAEIILLAMDWRVRSRVPRQFRVALMITASL